jgi:SAM-dependent methyltransferase
VKPRLLDLLACSGCGGRFGCAASAADGGEIVAGELTCRGCGATYPIVAGVPRFAGAAPPEARRTGEAFAYSWGRFSGEAREYERQFLDWIHPLDQSAFPGRLVLDAGCGKGRHAALAARYGAEVVAVDVGGAADVAYRNLGQNASIHVVSADLNDLPFDRCFDLAYCIGVLHHLEDPARGFGAIASRVKPGGKTAVWVYGRENNGWVVHLVTPLRLGLFSRMDRGRLELVSYVLGAGVWAIAHVIYPLLERAISWRRRAALFYGEYMAWLRRLPFREVVLIVLDHLIAPTAHYVTRDEVMTWHRALGARDVTLDWFRKNSWRATATVP